MSQPGPMRRHGRAPLFSVLGALVLGLMASVLTGPPAAVAARQEAPPPDDGGTAQPGGEPPQSIGSADNGQSSQESASQPPPELQSSWVVRVYKIRPSRLFKGL